MNEHGGGEMSRDDERACTQCGEPLPDVCDDCLEASINQAIAPLAERDPTREMVLIPRDAYERLMEGE